MRRESGRPRQVKGEPHPLPAVLRDYPKVRASGFRESPSHHVGGKVAPVRQKSVQDDGDVVQLGREDVRRLVEQKQRLEQQLLDASRAVQ